MGRRDCIPVGSRIPARRVAYTYLLSVRVRVSVPRHSVNVYARGYSRSTPTHRPLLAPLRTQLALWPRFDRSSSIESLPSLYQMYIYMYICVVEDGAQKGRRNEFLRPDDTDVPISRVAVLESLRAEIKFIGRAAFRKRKADGGREDGSGKNKVSGCRERATEELEKCGSV